MSTDMARKIQALLDKAASTTFPAEADALLEKAQALMVQHAVDASVLARARGAREEVATERFVVEPPYAGARAGLLSSAARASGCRLVRHGRGRGARPCTIVGFPSDISHALALYHALSIQALREMSSSPVPPGEGVRAFRHAFLLAFAARVGERLRATESAARSAAVSPVGEPGVAIVLADRSAAVDAAVKVHFPHLTTVRASVSSGSGLERGRAAAERASLGRPAVSAPAALPR